MGFFILILVVVGLFVWQFIASRRALATTSILTRYSPQQAAQTIDTAFGGARSALWTNVSGPGTINKRRRGYRGGITMSIDMTREANGVTRIDMWASTYYQYLPFFANFAGSVNSRKRAITRMLAEPDTQQLAAAVYGGQQGVAGSQPGSAPGGPADYPPNGPSRNQPDYR